MDVITYKVYDLYGVREIRAYERSTIAIPPTARLRLMKRRYKPAYPIDPRTGRGLTSKKEVQEWQPI